VLVFSPLANFYSLAMMFSDVRRILATWGDPRHASGARFFGALFVQRVPGMKSIRASRLVPVFASVATLWGCKSLPTTGGSGPERSPTAVLREREMTLIQADSEVFEAVVRAQLAADDDNYPHHLDGVRIDARPYGTASGYPENFAGVEGIDPTLTFGRAGKSEIEDLVFNRKEVLDALGAAQGHMPTYRQCAGAGVPTPPPARSSKTRPKATNVYAGCPRSPQYYLTVGLPVRGQPEGLQNGRDPHGRRVSLEGDVWTALVEEHVIGPNGWTVSQYAWLFRRNSAGKLELADTILIGVTQ
jgi:hypothetical protein